MEPNFKRLRVVLALFWSAVFVVMQVFAGSNYSYIEYQPDDFENLTCPQHPMFFNNIESLFEMQWPGYYMCLSNVCLGGLLCYIYGMKLLPQPTYFSREHATFLILVGITLLSIPHGYLFATRPDAFTDLFFHAIARERTLCSQVPEWININLAYLQASFSLYFSSFIPILFLWKHIFKTIKDCPLRVKRVAQSGNRAALIEMLPLDPLTREPVLELIDEESREDSNTLRPVDVLELPVPNGDASSIDSSVHDPLDKNENLRQVVSH